MTKKKLNELSPLFTDDVNKLSFRHRIAKTPDGLQLDKMEKKFVNDAILTERSRTKYKDIIPTYDASYDPACKAYFRRPEVKRLCSVTCTLRPGEADVKTPRR